jgi:regulatory protein spx
MSHVTFFTYPSCTSCRKTKAWLNEHGVHYKERHLMKDPPSVDELMQIIKMTTNGTEEILSTRSRTFKQLNVNVEELKISELIELLIEEPRLLKRPIITDGERLIVGYNRQALTSLLA